uniref:Methyltransferase type 11 domain-containing protein n=1 Tax=Nothobranchius pienaari TaxID=704102 RepID=A0A1A8LEQ4_9TELE
MACRLYEGKAHAASYWKYRISPSEHLMKQVLNFCEGHKGGPFELAVDVGCGSGQGTLLLAKHFTSVVGTDVSPAQIEMALQHAKQPNVTYRLCAAEELPFADSSADLVAAMSAFHWFDRPRFLLETHRVLKPRGCLALVNYTLDMELSYSDCCSHTLNQICREFYAALHPYRNPILGQNSIYLYKEAFETIPYPNKECYMGLVESFSSYQALLRDDPQKAQKLSEDVCQRLMSVMKVASAGTEVTVAVKYFYLLACKPEEA